MTLSISTSGLVCSAAITSGTGIVAEVSFAHEMRLLESLAPRIHEMLSAQGLVPGDLCSIACDIGPGSYTGVRIGVMTAKTLAWAIGCPVMGIGSLEALAYAHRCSTNAILAVLLRSRKGHAYWQIYTSAGAQRVPRSEVAMSSLADLSRGIRRLGLTECELVVCDLRREDLELLTEYMNDDGVRILRTIQTAVTARSIDQIARRRLHSPMAASSAIEMLPQYVTEPLIGPP